MSTSELVEADQVDDVPRSAIVATLVAFSFFGIAFRRTTITSNVIYADVTIALVILITALGVHLKGSRATATAVRALPWLWLILLGSLMGLWFVGITTWAISSLVRTFMAIGAFFAFWYTIDLRRLYRPALIATGAALLANTIRSFSSAAGFRAQGFIGSPNYLGHFAALAGVTLILAARRPWMKALAAVVMLTAIVNSASFGAFVMLIVAVVVWLVRLAGRNNPLLVVMLLTFSSLALVVALVVGPTSSSSEDEAYGRPGERSLISQERFERSQASRFTLWGQAWESFIETPTGLGPDGVKQQEIAIGRRHAQEVHADAFGYLVERSIPGLLGYLGLWATIWAASRPRGNARVLIVMLLTAGLFRETMHFRHGWLLLALAFALDYRHEHDEEPAVPRPALT